MAAKKRVDLSMQDKDKPDTDPTELAAPEEPGIIRYALSQLILSSPLTGSRMGIKVDQRYESQLAVGIIRSIEIVNGIAEIKMSIGQDKDGQPIFETLVAKDWSCGV